MRKRSNMGTQLRGLKLEDSSTGPSEGQKVFVANILVNWRQYFAPMAAKILREGFCYPTFPVPTSLFSNSVSISS